jgi:hypothetical protein
MMSICRPGRGSRIRVLATAALLLTVLLGSAAPLRAQAAGGAAVIAGRITDEGDAPLAGAVITLLDAAGNRALRTTLTDADGRYRIVNVAAGRYRVRVDLIGYEGTDGPVTAPAEGQVRLDLTLRVAAVALQGVEVEARRDERRERTRFETEAGVTARVIGGGELKILPGLAEADVLRAVELLPGVVSTSDFSSAFNVRGGSADQNLILIDGFPIFNPFHLGGLFSVFNPDMVARAELLAGGFGAEYGGRVSSVLNVESRVEAAEPGIRAEGGVSLLATRLAVRSPMPSGLARVFGGESGSWALSGRRSYFDQILRPVVDFPYHLTDVQFHSSMETAGDGRLRITGYTGEDVLDLTNFTPPGGDAADILRLAWSWGNDVIGAHWQQPVGRAWIADTRLGFSRYRDALRFADFDDTRFSSRISQLSFRGDLSRDFARVSARTGVEAGRLWYRNLAEAGGTQFAGGEDDGMMGAAYATARWRPSDAWLLEGGVRLDGWLAQDTTLSSLSPRLAAKRFIGPERDAAVKLSLGRYVQFLHSLRNEEFPLSNDIWITAGRRAPKVVSDQVQAGVEKYWGDDWSASLEAYARSFRGITEFNPASDPNDQTDDLLDGRGLSRGVDLMVRRTAGALQGWTTVSLLWAERTLPDPFAVGIDALPPEISFSPFWDRRLNVNVVLQYELPRAIEAGLRWNYGSPLPYTRPIAQHIAWEYRIETGRYRPSTPPFESEGDRVPLFIVPGERNAQRYPAYHRLDLTLRRSYQRRWGRVTPYLQVLNVYNRRNVLFYFYNFDRTPPTRSGISMFPVLPTVGVEASF